MFPFLALIYGREKLLLSVSDFKKEWLHFGSCRIQALLQPFHINPKVDRFIISWTLHFSQNNLISFLKKKIFLVHFLSFLSFFFCPQSADQNFGPFLTLIQTSLQKLTHLSSKSNAFNFCPVVSKGIDRSINSVRW